MRSEGVGSLAEDTTQRLAVLAGEADLLQLVGQRRLRHSVLGRTRQDVRQSRHSRLHVLLIYNSFILYKVDVLLPSMANM